MRVRIPQYGICTHASSKLVRCPHFKLKGFTINIIANKNIRADKVQLIDQDGKLVGVVPLSTALQEAKKVSLDLIEIAKSGEIPVCKILDYGKYAYTLKKRTKQPKTPEPKEIQIRPNIDPHDLDIKLKKMEDLLLKGHPIKVVVQFKGREITHKEGGEIIVQTIKERFSATNHISEPKREDRQIVLNLRRK